MAKTSKTLSFDLGASSGRAIISEFDGRVIKTREIHRFPNEPVNVGGVLYWDVLRLFHEIKQGILKAANDGGFDMIGIDSWGVDFGLIGSDGLLLENPIHYRDGRTDDFEQIYKIASREEIYASTGIQEMQINTLHQLYSLKRKRPQLLERASKLLFTPDLLNYFLTGEKRAEYTIASTSELLDAKSRNWDFSLIDKIGVDRSLFLPIVSPGTLCGALSEQLRSELGVLGADVFCVASHDTASAVLAAPSPKDRFVYIASGTWSLLGTELLEPELGVNSMTNNFTNEGGVDGKIRYLKNIMGTWLMQECRRQWRREGVERSFDELDSMANAAAPFKSFIDVDASQFIKPGDMPARVREYCAKTGQAIPESDGEIARLINEGLALKYKHTVEALESCTGVSVKAVNIVGGGAKSVELCKMAANALGRPVSAGPVEATALGNAAALFIAAGEIGGVSEARQVVANSFAIDVYEPSKNCADWDAAYDSYLSKTGLSRAAAATAARA